MGKLEPILAEFPEMYAANYDSSAQIVVSGVCDAKHFIRACQQAKIRAVQLQVAGAFHTKFMAAPNERMNFLVRNAHFNNVPTCGFIANQSSGRNCAKTLRAGLEQTLSSRNIEFQ